MLVKTEANGKEGQSRMLIESVSLSFSPHNLRRLINLNSINVKMSEEEKWCGPVSIFFGFVWGQWCHLPIFETGQEPH